VDRVLCPGGVLALSGYSIVPHLIHPEKADELAAVLEVVRKKITFQEIIQLDCLF